MINAGISRGLNLPLGEVFQGARCVSAEVLLFSVNDKAGAG